jgi:hypothetical protein
MRSPVIERELGSPTGTHRTRGCPDDDRALFAGIAPASAARSQHHAAYRTNHDQPDLADRRLHDAPSERDQLSGPKSRSGANTNSRNL